MTKLDERQALANAAVKHGVDVDAETLLVIVHSAFAPHETMTASERQFLLDSGAPADSFDPQAQAEARARLMSRAASTRASAAPLLPTSEVAAMLGRDPANVRRSASAGDLYAIANGSGRESDFPAWQFVDGKPLRGLRQVIARLPQAMHPLSVEGFMTSPQEELDDTAPIQWLATGGDVEVVVRLAEAVAYE